MANSIRDQIDRARRAQRLSISELARRGGITRNNLSRFLAGYSDINTQTADRLLKALEGVSDSGTPDSCRYDVPGSAPGT